LSLSLGQHAEGVNPVDELYTAPLRDFITRRTAIAARLREQGKTKEAKALASIGKPKATIWAINGIARRSPKTVKRVLSAFDRLKAAQLKQPAKLGEAAAEFKSAVEHAAHEALEALKAAGTTTTLDTHRRIANTLRGAAAEAREALGEGSLEKEYAPTGFDVFATAARPQLRVVAGGKRGGGRRRAS
jgi:hypothetical protein